MVDVDICDVNLINSRIHNLSCVYKIISLIIMLLSIVIANSLMDIFMINLFLFVAIVWSNIKFRSFFKIIHLFSIFLFLVFFILSLVYFDMVIALLWVVKIIDVIVLLLVIGLSTRYFDVMVGVSFILKPVSSFVKNSVIYKIGNSIKYIGLMYEEMVRIEGAKKIRGVYYRKNGCIDKIDVLIKDFISIVSFTCFRISILKDNVIVNNGELGFLNFK